MSYEPTNWQAGDIVTSAKLNKLEQGLANLNILVVHSEQIDNPEGTDTSNIPVEVNTDTLVSVEEATDSEVADVPIQYFRLDKTWQEIYNAELAFIQWIDDNYKSVDQISQISIEDNIYFVRSGRSGEIVFSTSSPDDYPIYGEGAGGSDWK